MFKMKIIYISVVTVRIRTRPINKDPDPAGQISTVPTGSSFLFLSITEQYSFTWIISLRFKHIFFLNGFSLNVSSYIEKSCYVVLKTFSQFYVLSVILFVFLSVIMLVCLYVFLSVCLFICSVSLFVIASFLSTVYPCFVSYINDSIFSHFPTHCCLIPTQFYCYFEFLLDFLFLHFLSCVKVATFIFTYISCLFFFISYIF